MNLRREQPEDTAAVREVERLAFGRDAEADLIDTLRDTSAWVLSLVAAETPEVGCAEDGDEGRLVGHLLITRVTATTDAGDEVSLLGLGPVAVVPWRQGEGVGTMLVEAGLEQMRGGAYPAVVVVGNPRYYSRFGFLPGSHWGLRWNGDAPDEAFMAVELSSGSLAGIRGVVRYRPEFAGL